MPQHVIVSEVPLTTKPILIIDKKGILGLPLAKKLSKESIVVLATGHDVPLFKNLILIPYKRKIPLIPNNTYTKIIVISYGEKETFAMLPAIAKKAAETKARIAFVIGMRLGTEALYKRLLHKYPSLSVCLTGDIFGGDIWEMNLITDYLLQIKKHSIVVIPNNGLFKTYPVFIDDVVSGILDAVFVKNLDKSMYFLFPSFPITALSVARTLKQLHPEVGIDFHKTQEKSFPLLIPTDGEYLLPIPYPLEKKLAKVDIEVKKEPRIIFSSQMESAYKRPMLFVLFGFLLLFLMPFFATAIFSLFGAVLLKGGAYQLESGKYESAKTTLAASKNAFAIASETGGSAESLLSVVRMEKLSSSALKSINNGKDLATAGELFVDSYIRLIAIQDGKSKNPKEDFASGMNSLRQAMVIANNLAKDQNTPKALRESLTTYSPVMELITATSDVYPTLLGFYGKKTYLVLFQNNMELRPGGGFIGSYGLLTLDNGKVTDFTIHNVYDADGKLKEDIEPPYGLRRYMGIKHFYLRDSNFSPDFPKSAAQAAYFLELETGVKPDGVLALDMHFFKSLFEITGPVKVPNFNETVQADNVYLTTQRHAENDSFPGSRQKQDFLKALFDGFSQKLQSKGGANPLLVKKVSEGIKGKHIMFVALDPSIQNVLNLNNVSGSLLDVRKSNSTGINDTFGISEANIGGNKGNFYLTRSFSHTVSISTDDEIVEEATISYTNSSKKDSEFGGDYKAYIRVMLPNEARLSGIVIDGKSLPVAEAVTESALYENPRFTPPDGIEVAKTSEEGKQLVGFPLTVPYNTTKKVSLRYRLLQKAAGATFTYSMRFFKQPGTEADPYIFKLLYPNDYRVISTNLEKKGNTLQSFGSLTSDREFVTKFVR